MSVSNWLCLSKYITKHQSYTNKKAFHVLIFLFIKAHFSKYTYKDGTTINKGQLITSVKSIVSATGLSTQNVRTALKKLEAIGTIKTRPQAFRTIITLNHYSKHQSLKKSFFRLSRDILNQKWFKCSESVQAFIYASSKVNHNEVHKDNNIYKAGQFKDHINNICAHMKADKETVIAAFKSIGIAIVSKAHKGIDKFKASRRFLEKAMIDISQKLIFIKSKFKTEEKPLVKNKDGLKIDYKFKRPIDDLKHKQQKEKGSMVHFNNHPEISSGESMLDKVKEEFEKRKLQRQENVQAQGLNNPEYAEMPLSEYGGGVGLARALKIMKSGK